MDVLQLDPQHSRARQSRLLDAMHQLGVDLAILTSRPAVQWLTGGYFGTVAAPIAVLTSNGHVTLVYPAGVATREWATDEHIEYPWKLHATMRDDQRPASSEALPPLLLGGICSARSRRTDAAVSSMS